MPTRLLGRCRPDSVLEFRLAARERLEDGRSAAAAGRRTAAVYLFGYAAEMTLKAGYFAASGFASAQPITRRDLETARKRAPAWGSTGRAVSTTWESWARLLVSMRTATPGLVYSIPGFGNDVLRHAGRFRGLWSETLRYHKNVAYEHEVDRARHAAGWFVAHSTAI